MEDRLVGLVVVIRIVVLRHPIVLEVCRYSFPMNRGALLELNRLIPLITPPKEVLG